MLEPGAIDDLANRLSGLLPPQLQAVKGELDQNIKQVLLAQLQKLDLVTREEYEVHAELLKRTRIKLEALEKQLAELEAN